MTNNKFFESFRNRAKALANGCPLMDGRTKETPDAHINERLTIDDAFHINGDNGGYYVVTVREYNEIFFLSGGALTVILDGANEVANREGVPIKDVCGGLEFSFGEKTKTKNGRDFRPVHVY